MTLMALMNVSRRAMMGRLWSPCLRLRSHTVAAPSTRTAPVSCCVKTTWRSAFSFAGPRSLEDILKLDLLDDKNENEVKDIWLSYHEAKENMHGVVIPGERANSILSRASECPFYVQPVFRDGGFFMLITQFQEPSHFLMAYLEDYKMDPARAQPLLTFSVFDDLITKTKIDADVGLVRVDVVNGGIRDDEGLKVVQNTLDAYCNEDEFFHVKTFNKSPNSFDIDDFISFQNQKWKTTEEDTKNELLK